MLFDTSSLLSWTAMQEVTNILTESNTHVVTTPMSWRVYTHKALNSPFKMKDINPLLALLNDYSCKTWMINRSYSVQKVSTWYEASFMASEIIEKTLTWTLDNTHASTATTELTFIWLCDKIARCALPRFPERCSHHTLEIISILCFACDSLNTLLRWYVLKAVNRKWATPLVRRHGQSIHSPLAGVPIVAFKTIIYSVWLPA